MAARGQRASAGSRNATYRQERLEISSHRADPRSVGKAPCLRFLSHKVRSRADPSVTASSLASAGAWILSEGTKQWSRSQFDMGHAAWRLRLRDRRHSRCWRRSGPPYGSVCRDPLPRKFGRQTLAIGGWLPSSEAMRTRQNHGRCKRRATKFAWR